jgi:hypothetical protein
MTTPFRKLKSEWMKDRNFRAKYERLKPEFPHALALIKARGKAGLTKSRNLSTDQAAPSEETATLNLSPDFGSSCSRRGKPRKESLPSAGPISL